MRVAVTNLLWNRLAVLRQTRREAPAARTAVAARVFLTRVARCPAQEEEPVREEPVKEEAEAM